MLVLQLAPREKLWSAHEAVVARALELLHVTRDDVLADYGCGDGRVLAAAARDIGCRCIGYEINADRARDAVAALDAAGLGHLVTIHATNALDADFSQPSCVFLYLIDRGLRILFPLLNDAARRRPGGIRVVTALYRFANVPPLSKSHAVVDADVRVPLHVYHLPVDVAADAGASAGVDADGVTAPGDGAGGGGGGGAGEEVSGDADASR
jgi:hypothetical protein